MKTYVLLVFLLLSAGSFPADSILTSIAEAKGVNREHLALPRSFDFCGVLLRMNEKVLTFSDADGGATFSLRGLSQIPELHQWDRIRIKGEMMVDGPEKTRLFVAQKVEVLGSGRPVPPVDATAQRINDGQFDFRFVRILGVFASCVRDEVAPNYLWATLKTSDGSCLLCMQEHVLESKPPRDMTDAEIEVVGLAMPIQGLRHNFGRHVAVFDAKDITVLKPPPENPLDAPLLSSEDGDTSHRQRISGCVVTATRACFFLRTGIGRIIRVVPSAGEPTPGIGEMVDVAGFPEYTPYRLSLSNAIVSPKGKSTAVAEKTQRIDIADLFVDSKGCRRFRTQLTGNFLTMKGVVAAATEDEMEVSNGTNSVFVVLGAIHDRLSEIPNVGSIVETTGLCWPEFREKSESGVFPQFLRFTIYPRDAADIRVISSPPWWTPFRLSMLAICLVALLAVSVIWNVALNVKAELRGRELYEERASHAIAEKRVEERTRLAVELHDSISQTLTGVSMQLEVGATDTAKTMLTACRGELRRCLWDLRSRTFEEKDMTEAIERTLEPHSVGAKIAVRFNVPRERLDDSTTHTILRIVRELVVNAIRHGKATHIKVAGECHGDTISFSVADNGYGFDPAAAPGPKEGHFGLLGVRERLKEFRGEMKIESSPGKGAKMTVSMAIGRETPDERREVSSSDVLSRLSSNVSRRNTKAK